MNWIFQSIILFWKFIFWLFGAWLKLWVLMVGWIGSSGLRRDRASITRPEQGRPSKLTAVSDFGDNPGALRMWMYAPKGLPRGSPLVVVLHGSTQTAAAYAEGAGWIALADQYAFAVLCPEQTRENSRTLSFNWFRPQDMAHGRGEPRSIAMMVERTIRDVMVDEKKVFITGLSSGGAMTAIMLATYPGVFAAGAVIAGLPFGTATTLPTALWAMSVGRALTPQTWGNKVRLAARPTAWPSVSIWQGGADKVVNPSLADSLIAQWTNVHGINGSGTQANTSDGRGYQVWHSDDGAAKVERHDVPGMGHGTPLKTSGPHAYGTAGPYLLDVGLSSSFEIAKSWGVAKVEA